MNTREDEEEMIDVLQEKLGVPENPPLPPEPPKPKPQVEIKDIVKHNRPRVQHNVVEKGYVIVPGEPDIVKTPEIESPEPEEDSLDVKEMEKTPVNFAAEDISPTFTEPPSEEVTEVEEEPQTVPEAMEEPVAEEIKEDTEEKPANQEEIEEDELTNTPAPEINVHEKHKQVFSDFLKSGLSQTTKHKKKKVKKGIGKKLMSTIIIILIVLAAIAGFVFYVNTYILNNDNAVKKAESTFGQSLRPGYLPLGYQASYETNASSNGIDYVYLYSPNKSNRIDIKITKTDVTPETILEKVIKPLGKDYTQSQLDNTTIWYVGTGKALFIKDSKLYEITSSAKISSEELRKIAEGLI